MNNILCDYPYLAENLPCRYSHIQTYVGNLYRDHRKAIRSCPIQCKKAIQMFGPWEAAEENFKKHQKASSQGLSSSAATPNNLIYLGRKLPKRNLLAMRKIIPRNQLWKRTSVSHSRLSGIFDFSKLSGLIVNPRFQLSCC